VHCRRCWPGRTARAVTPARAATAAVVVVVFVAEAVVMLILDPVLLVLSVVCVIEGMEFIALTHIKIQSLCPAAALCSFHA
jgi:hypothetical protein